MRFLRPAFLTSTGLAVLAFFCGPPGVVSFCLIPLYILGCPIAALGMLIYAVLLAARRQRRQSASIALAVFLPVLMLVPINWSMECLHLALTTTLGLGQLGSTSTQSGLPFAVYDWSVELAGGTNTFLTRDITDGIALPPSRHKIPPAAGDGWQAEGAGKVRHLIGHYYICDIG